MLRATLWDLEDGLSSVSLGGAMSMLLPVLEGS
jgi:hypothetical protein